jgi:uncharacterized membrane protein YfcA
MIEFSDIQNIYWVLPVLGFIIGIFGTMVGGGGGFFFLPVLTLLLKVPAQTAVLTSLVAILPICIAGSWGHSRKGNIDFRIAVNFIEGGIVGALLGVLISYLLSGAQLKVAFGIYSILISINMVLSKRGKQIFRDKQEGGIKLFKKGKVYLFSVFAGMITGTFGTSGTAPVIAGLFSLKMPLKIVIGTSLFIVLFNTLFAVCIHFLMGTIDLTIILFLTVGSAIGAIAGPKLLSKMKLEKADRSAGYWYAAVMIIIGVLMITGRN